MVDDFSLCPLMSFRFFEDDRPAKVECFKIKCGMWNHETNACGRINWYPQEN